MSKPKEKKPVAITLLSSQIKQGIYPTKETLNDVFAEVDMKYYKDIALALLEARTDKQVTREEPQQERPPANPNRRTGGLSEGGEVVNAQPSTQEKQQRARWS